jgi:hypothetical protein
MKIFISWSGKLSLKKELLREMEYRKILTSIEGEESEGNGHEE